jgi:hypothetical protein
MLIFPASKVKIKVKGGGQECPPYTFFRKLYNRLFPLRYNGLVADVKPFRLTESVKAAG